MSPSVAGVKVREIESCLHILDESVRERLAVIEKLMESYSKGGLAFLDAAASHTLQANSS